MGLAALATADGRKAALGDPKSAGYEERKQLLEEYQRHVLQETRRVDYKTTGGATVDWKHGGIAGNLGTQRTETHGRWFSAQRRNVKGNVDVGMDMHGSYKVGGAVYGATGNSMGLKVGRSHNAKTGETKDSLSADVSMIHDWIKVAGLESTLKKLNFQKPPRRNRHRTQGELRAKT